MEKGYYQTEISLSERMSRVLKHRVDIEVGVQKKKFTGIHEIEVVGNTAFSDQAVLRKLTGLREQKIWRFWARSKYVPHQLRDAKQALIAAYREAGYRDAEVELDSLWLYSDKAVKSSSEDI